MAKSLRSFPRSERDIVAERRLSSKSMGLGYWGAYDFMHPAKKKVPTEKTNEDYGYPKLSE